MTRLSAEFIETRRVLSRCRGISGILDYLRGKLKEARDPEDIEILRYRIKAQEARYKRIREETLKEIDTLEDPKYIEILSLYFIDQESISKISRRLGYSERYTRTLYSDAIKTLSDRRRAE